MSLSKPLSDNQLPEWFSLKLSPLPELDCRTIHSYIGCRDRLPYCLTLNISYCLRVRGPLLFRQNQDSLNREQNGMLKTAFCVMISLHWPGTCEGYFIQGNKKGSLRVWPYFGFWGEEMTGSSRGALNAITGILRRGRHWEIAHTCVHTHTYTHMYTHTLICKQGRQFSPSPYWSDTVTRRGIPDGRGKEHTPLSGLPRKQGPANTDFGQVIIIWTSLASSARIG